jgi:endonuclease/exonuclease/phosphatase family metal-dependent hydrolase
VKGTLLLLLWLLPDTNQPADSFNVSRQVLHVPGNGNAKTIRVISWNVDHGSHLGQISGVLRQSGADLCLLQEVDWNAARSGVKDVGFALAARLGLNAAYGIEFEELSQERSGPAYIGQATLTRLPLAKTRVLRFARQSNFWQPHSWLPSSLPLMQRRLGSRIALVTELLFAGRLLVVYNLHLESRSMGLIQAAQLDEILADLAHYPSGTSALIGGDINSKYFPSVFLRRMEKAGFHSALGERIERTHKLAMALDWIFVRGPLTLDEGAVDRAVKGSDHFPVAALMHMRTTMILDETLVTRARELTGITEKTALVHAALQALISREASRRLAALGGTESDLEEIPRRREAL